MQLSSAFVDDVVGDFFNWVRFFDEKDWEWNFDHLQDYIAAWLEQRPPKELSHSMTITGGQYDNWLLVALIIIDAYNKDPSRLDYAPLSERRERRVSTLVDLDRESAKYFDKCIYQQEVFRHLQGRSV